MQNYTRERVVELLAFFQVCLARQSMPMGDIRRVTSLAIFLSPWVLARVQNVMVAIYGEVVFVQNIIDCSCAKPLARRAVIRLLPVITGLACVRAAGRFLKFYWTVVCGGRRVRSLIGLLIDSLKLIDGCKVLFY